MAECKCRCVVSEPTLDAGVFGESHVRCAWWAPPGCCIMFPNQSRGCLADSSETLKRSGECRRSCHHVISILSVGDRQTVRLHSSHDYSYVVSGLVFQQLQVSPGAKPVTVDPFSGRYVVKTVLLLG